MSDLTSTIRIGDELIEEDSARAYEVLADAVEKITADLWNLTQLCPPRLRTDLDRAAMSAQKVGNQARRVAELAATYGNTTKAVRKAEKEVLG
jgi:hypothetical protein